MISFALLLVAAPTVHCYLTEATMTLPNGRPAGTSVSVVKRTLNPAKNEIEERVISLRGDEPAQEFVTTLTIDGSKVKISMQGMEGTGTLKGPAWNWSEMRFTMKMDQPKMTIEGVDHFAAHGMSAEKTVRGADGKVQVNIKERGTEITEATFAQLRSRLVK